MSIDNDHNPMKFRLIDDRGREIKYRIKEGTVEVWFASMDPDGEPYIWTGSLDELVYEVGLTVEPPKSFKLGGGDRESGA